MRQRWLSIQPALDGTARIHGTLDPETAAAALTAFATTETDDGRKADDNASGDHAEPGGPRRQANVDIFKALCEQRLTRRAPTEADGEQATEPVGEEAAEQGGEPTAGARDTADAASPSDHRDAPADRASKGAADGPGGRPSDGQGRSCAACGSAPSIARPSMLIIAQAAALDRDAPAGSSSAHLLWNTTWGPVELTPAAVQRLACDATIRTVILDGAQPLGVTAAHPKVSTTLRAALIARDGGCRFPACHQPADVCENHHITPVLDGGATRLGNLLLLCRNHHHAVHDSGWTVTLHGNASATFRRRRVTLTSVSRHDQQLEPGERPPGGRPSRPTITGRRNDPGETSDPAVAGGPDRSGDGPPLPF